MELRKIKPQTIMFLSGTAMLASEIAKQLCLTFYVHPGVYEWWYLPFQLCSIPMYVCLIAGLTKHRRIYETGLSYLSTFGLLGGIMSFCDTTGFHYPVPILTLHSWLWHIGLVMLGIWAGREMGGCLSGTASGKKKSRIPFRYPACVYLICCLIAQAINIAAYCAGCVPIDMFYISPMYPMRQILFADLGKMIGNIPVILLYILATILGAYLLERIWWFLDCK